MSRKTPLAGPSISLFPFLAVLLCTMGSLLVLLVLFSRSAKHGESAEAAQARVAEEQELELARDSLAWRREQLAGVRDRTADDLAKARLQLAGVEENNRGLQDELERLVRTAEALDSAGGRAAPEQGLSDLEARLKSARESLEKARAESRTRPPAYAVVPYVGRDGTHRRPLYIECCGDGVFLQPEGIRLSPSDFEGPPGPGNPLACALRAAREHIVAGQGGTTDPAAQPYPLLLVRPSGVMAYYAAREALQSWGSDFGYQLVDEDWTLNFPPRDPMLADVEKRAIEESRQRLAWLAEVRPARPTKPARQYRASQTRGGVVADGGPSVLGDQSRFDWATSQQQAANVGGTPGGDGQFAGGGGGRSGGGADGGGSAADEPSGSGGGGSLDGIRAVPVASRRGAGNGPAAGGGQSGPDARNADARYAGGASKFTVGPAAGGGSAAGEARGTAAGSAASGGSAAAGASSVGGAAGGTGSANGSQGGAGGDMSAPAMPGLFQPGGGSAAGQAGATASLAQSRGRNWASLATQDRPIPLTRPIRVECAVNEFRLFDDGGRRVQTRIPVDGETAAAIDPLVAALHERVGRWGIAGDRMYWKPLLVLSETPDGRSRREDLERLLAESGIDTRSTDVRDQIRPLPPVERSAAFAPGR